MKSNTKKQLFNIFIVLALSAITIVTILLNSNELNFDNIKKFVADANPIYIVAAFVCWICFVLFEALSIHLILKSFKIKPKIKSSIAYSTSDIYYSAITPSASGGQPASAYYMIRDGISSGISSFTLVFNLIGYTAAILIIGSFSLIFGFDIFLNLPGFVKFLIIFGFVTQVLLLIFFIACMCRHNLVKKFCFFIVKLLSKIKIIKNKDKWFNKIESLVDKYKSCYEELKSHKKTIIPVILINVAQRLSQMLISVFICKSAYDCSFIEMTFMQGFVLLGYNSLPIPGGSGAFEYLYLKIYTLSLPASYVVVSMMVTRFISYYFSIIVSGIYTLVYHMVATKNKNNKDTDLNETNDNKINNETNNDASLDDKSINNTSNNDENNDNNTSNYDNKINNVELSNDESNKNKSNNLEIIQ